MKTRWFVFLMLGVILAAYGYFAYNGLVDKEEEVNKKWADVEAQYQRRADLIPNLVNTVKGYAAHESATFQSVVEARAKATSLQIPAENISAEQLSAYLEAQSQVTSALGRLIAVAENYPELKADRTFQELQAQLEGTENRISVARSDFNEAARNYNVAVRRFPSNIAALLFGFEQKAYFDAAPGAETAPEVQF